MLPSVAERAPQLRQPFPSPRVSRATVGGYARSPMEGKWIRDGFETPQRVELATGHHLRPIRESDVEIDHPAVMGAREKLWSKYGEAWGWPPADMTIEKDREDLRHHEDEINAQ